MAKDTGGFFSGRKKPEATGPRREVDLSDFESEVVRLAKATGTIVSINKGLILPDPDNPRRTFDEESLNELARSLDEEGLIQPIIVREVANGKYMICCGERRWRAAMRANLTDLQAIIRNDISGLKLLQMQVQENEQREAMRPLDLAHVYKRAMTELGSQTELCIWAKKSKAYISNYLQLAEAPPEIQAISNTVTDATSLHLIHRLLQKSPAEGKAILESIEAGTISGNSIRRTARDALKPSDGQSKPRHSKTSKGTQEINAAKAEWQHTDIARVLVVETNTGEKWAITLPAGFE